MRQRSQKVAVPEPAQSATQPDIDPGMDKVFTAPACPRCGGKMVLRIPWSVEAMYAFWGCRQYPRCSGTRAWS